MQSHEPGICLFSTSCFKFIVFSKYIKMELRHMPLLAELTLPWASALPLAMCSLLHSEELQWILPDWQNSSSCICAGQSYSVIQSTVLLVVCGEILQ